MSAREWTPGGSQTRSKAWHVFGGAPFPRYIDYAVDATVWSEGETYTDWIAALASVGLGYGHPAVDAAVRLQLWRGTAFPLPARLEEKVAELLIDVIGWGEQVRWVKTGSEATVGAMMLARAYTHRQKVVSIGYHGWHEAHLPSPNLVDVPWGSWSVMDAVDCTTAAVLVEPMRDKEPPEDWLHSIQRVCRARGALLIMDEIVTGFRWALGGATRIFGLEPDLCCYGKAMANGYPLAAIVGPRKIMKHATEISSTYGGEGVGLAAARATIEVYRREDVVGRMWRLGRMLQEACPGLTGYPVHPRFLLSDDYTTSEKVIPLVQEVAKRGHLVHPSGFNIMHAHTEADVRSLAEAINCAEGALAQSS